jgi:hypothetical protein
MRISILAIKDQGMNKVELGLVLRGMICKKFLRRLSARNTGHSLKGARIQLKKRRKSIQKNNYKNSRVKIN